ncbi:hypothetical protein [Candidatus Poriferisodalis sp.]|uniref:hypothetical protein n=1 Tax=Candidatus Poriferisodalis sp. TaxID=3101277 RepID=UPI003B013D4B
MNTPMNTTQAYASPTRLSVWSFVGLLAFGFMVSLAIFYAVDTLGVPPLAILVACPCFLVVCGTVGTRRVLRRREAARAEPSGVQ